jgi:hypothetical protein
MSNRRRRIVGPLDIALGLALLAVLGLAVYRYRAQREPESLVARVPQETEGSLVLRLEMRDIDPELAAQVRVGDVFSVAGKELARIRALRTEPVVVLSYNPDTAPGLEPQTNRDVRIVLDVEVPRWLDEVTGFKLGNVADFETSRYTIPVRIIGIEEERPAPRLPAAPGMRAVIVAHYVPDFIAAAVAPGAHGVDDAGETRIIVDEVLASDPSPVLMLYAINDYSSHTESIVAGMMRLSPGAARDLRVAVRIWPDRAESGWTYEGKPLKPGMRHRFQFRRFTIEGQVVSLEANGE